MISIFKVIKMFLVDFSISLKITYSLMRGFVTMYAKVAPRADNLSYLHSSIDGSTFYNVISKNNNVVHNFIRGN